MNANFAGLAGLALSASVVLVMASVIVSCAKGDDATAGGNAGSGSGASGEGGTGGQIQLGPELGAPTDPSTCAAAADAHTYIGCDFWPTSTLNPVWSIFDFAVVVANIGSVATDITVDIGGNKVASTTIPPNELVKVFLPWVPAIKGPDTDTCGTSSAVTNSISGVQSAYHLVATSPVIVYQFSALEFRGAGGPPGKDWGSCPGNQLCTQDNGDAAPIGCFSFSNDASILLPTAAMTGNYRVTTLPPGNGQGFVAITGTQDGTSVSVKLGAAAEVLAGGPVTAGSAGQVLTFPMNAGDVVELVATDASSDLSGSIVQADHPVQVIAGSACASIPNMISATQSGTCDHLEESVIPAETLGRHYFVASPTGPLGTPVAQAVRLHGNVDGTQLSYPQGTPDGAPTTIDAGQNVDLGMLTGNFEVVGDHELAISTYLLSAGISDPNDIVSRGDPSQSSPNSVDQYRTSYVFLAPDDYDVSFVDVVMPIDAMVVLDGAPLPAVPATIGSSGYGVARVRLGTGKSGAHSITSNLPVGIQVLGYGSYTSYQVPGGLDLKVIAPPLDPIQ